MKNKTIFWVAVFSVVAYVGYKKLYSNDRFAKQIISANKYGGTLTELMKFDLEFLKSWAKAARKNDPTFVHDGKTYNTQGGKAIRQ